MSAGVTWVGLDRFLGKLAKLVPETIILTDEGLNAVAEDVLRKAQANVEANLKDPSIDTGEVAASGHVDRTADGADVIFDHRAAAFIHAGVRGNEAHRNFLSQPAVDAEKDVRDVAVGALRKAL